MLNGATCLLLLLLHAYLTSAARQGIEDRRSFEINSAELTADSAVQADSVSNTKKCRFTWQWETLVYGDICLPARKSRRKNSRSTAIKRHRHRHKDHLFSDEPDIVNRHVNLRMKGSLLGIEGHAERGTSKSMYQMDAPVYKSLVSELTVLHVIVGSCWQGGYARTYG